MTAIEDKFAAVLQEAEKQGSWAQYAVWVMGDCDSGDDELDEYIRSLYEANESVHRKANQLSLRYDLPFYGGL